MKDALLTVRVILRSLSTKTLILSILRRLNCDFYVAYFENVITVDLHIPSRLCNVFVVDLAILKYDKDSLRKSYKRLKISKSCYI